jgi:16S rRNA (guanine527-N7)-methyltransferase
VRPDDQPPQGGASVEAEVDPLAGDRRLPDLFGTAWPAVEGFRALLVREGVLRGLVGPREVSRLWERHLVNSAAVVPFLPERGTIVDVGSGAGLPGIVIAAMRPEAHVVLLEPMERRTDWLTEVADRLALSNVEVLRGRAEDQDLAADAVTARAVAALDKLYGWTLPLLRPGGTLVALKGGRAQEEIEAGAATATALGGGAATLRTAPTLPGLESTSVVLVTKERDVPRPGKNRVPRETASRRTRSGGSTKGRRR